MAQGYPPGSYAPQQYGQQPHPPQYAYPPQQLQQPPYGQAPQYPQQYPQGSQYPQQYPHQHQQQGAPQQAPRPPLPPRPKEASGFRRYPAVIVDCLLAVVPGFLAAKAAAGPGIEHGGGAYFGALLAVGFGISFVNQVLLARLAGFSVGKGLLALRVIRAKDASRPHLWRLTKRWAIGFVIIAVALITEDFDEESEVFAVRVVRWKHLREYRRAAAPLG